MTVGFATLAPFSMGFDTLGPVSAGAAAAFRADGFRWVARYVETLTIAERDVLFDAGLGIALVLEAQSGPLDAAAGSRRGALAMQKVAALGAPAGLHVTADAEGTTGSAADVSAYFTALGSRILAAGFASCLYVGAGQPLDGAQLYAIPTVHLYWRAASLGLPEPTGCGYALMQALPLDQTIHGERVDLDIAARDARGRGMIMWWPADVAA